MVTVQYPATDLPVQSTGFSSTVALVAAFQVPHATFAPEGPGGPRVVQVYTPPLHVTFAQDGSAPAFRDAATQARVNALDSADPFTKVTSLKVYDKQAGGLRELSHVKVAPNGEPRAFVRATEGRPELPHPPGLGKGVGGGQSP